MPSRRCSDDDGVINLRKLVGSDVDDDLTLLEPGMGMLLTFTYDVMEGPKPCACR